MTSRTAASRNIASCHRCLKLVEASSQNCPRCGSSVHLRKKDSVQRTLALLTTALILYVPANVLPIMYTDQFGSTIESTIIGGVVLLLELGSWPVALVIFVASVMVPVGKITALFYLCWCASSGAPVSRLQCTILYRITELIGRWSMIDVFVVAVLVALVHLEGILVVRAGIAAVAFAIVVLLTIIAAESFDPRLIWDEYSDDRP